MHIIQSIGSDAIGWLYQGMANRLALDMGLNMDPGALGAIKAMPTSEIELRRQLYWAYYCTDKLAACYTGRICTMLVSYQCLSKSQQRFLPGAGFPRCRAPTKWHSAIDDKYPWCD